VAVSTRPLTPALRADLVAFFAANAEFNWCFCTYWDFRGDNRDWIRRQADENRRLRDARLDTLAGVLAYDGARPVGWCRLDRRAPDDKLAEFYGPPPPDTLAVTCFCVLEAARRQGCARTLLAAAIDHARALGARRLEGFPRPESAAVIPDGEAWTGPAPVFAQAGFVLTPHGEHRCIASLAL
jgi:GNAT superfamily N-acetyltransferase